MEPVALAADRPSFSESGLATADILLAAEALAARGDLFDALQAVEWVLESYPNDVDALAGQGWLLARSATPDQLEPAELGLSFLNRALEAEPDHLEALVYRAFVHNFLGDTAAAAADLAVFDAQPIRPADLRSLILAFGLREALADP